MDMALFGARGAKPFRTRGPQRDRETDAARLSRLRGYLDDLCLEIERERDGLRSRYENVTTRAAFSQQVLENEQASPGMSAAVDELTRTMMNYTRRLVMLEEQVTFVSELRERAGQFPLQKEEQEVSTRMPDQPSTERRS
jgi:hypothetical protein